MVGLDVELCAGVVIWAGVVICLGVVEMVSGTIGHDSNLVKASFVNSEADLL